MFSRYFIAACLLAFVVAIHAAEDKPVDPEIPILAEPRNPALALAVRWIAKELGKHVAKCAGQAALACKSNWGHFHALINCAKGFAKNNKGRCLL